MDCIKLGSWNDITQRSVLQHIQSKILPSYLKEMRWFGGKEKQITSVKIASCIAIPTQPLLSYLWLLKVEYKDLTSEKYILPACFMADRKMNDEQMKPPVLCEMYIDLERGWLVDAVWCSEFRMALFRLFAKQAEHSDNNQVVKFTTSASFAEITKDLPLTSRLLHAEQSNTSIIFGNKLFLKLYRKVETGINPDIELSKFLSEDARFDNVPKWLGSIEWNSKQGIIGVGILQEMLSDITVAWDYFRPIIREAINKQSIDEFRSKIGQLATLTSDMHRTLAIKSGEDESFDIHELITRLKDDVKQTFDILGRNAEKLAERVRPEAYHLLDLRSELEQLLEDIDVANITSKKIRVHGDYHLGQVLVTGDHFKVTDFEGEPGRTYAERRLSQPILKDVAGMVRSFQYATYSVLMEEGGHQLSMQQLEDVYHNMSDLYVDTYLNSIEQSGLVPATNDAKTLLQLFIIEKALYELRYELNNRPDWIVIPIAGLVDVILHQKTSFAH